MNEPDSHSSLISLHVSSLQPPLHDSLGLNRWTLDFEVSYGMILITLLVTGVSYLFPNNFVPLNLSQSNAVQYKIGLNPADDAQWLVVYP